MRFFKIDLLTLLISLFLFASCERTSTIGLEVDPSSSVQGGLLDTATVTSRTIQENAAATNGLSTYPFGFLKDPVLGTTEASLALGVNIPSESFSFGTNPVLDSAVLVLNFDSEFYGDSTANYSIDVHQLSNNLSKETSYLSNRSYAFESTTLGNYSGRIFPKTPFRVTDVLTGAPDTAMTVKPQLRLKLDKAAITTKLLNLDATSLKYNSYFQSAFKGLHVQIRPSAQANLGNGGVMFFNFAAQTATTSTSGLVLYFRRQNASTTTLTDTVSVNFPISTALGSAAATSITHNYSTAVQNQLNAPTTQFATTYLQPLGGLRNKLTFPYLKKMKQEVGPMVINKAELVIDLSSATDVAPFRAAPRLALYKNDIAGQRKNIPDNDLGDGYTYAGDPRANSSVFGGYFDSVKKRYVFVITAYVQDLLDGKTEDYGTYLGVIPTTATTTNYYLAATNFATAGRAVIGSFKKNPAAGDNLIKLNIYYTKIN
ncbi:DUF4270 domain-containing protein [Nubsella zeaxanthinifaciens]|uniref:DUF4270 domain-containing protein n=1 Tax=Nubsella zeaxanthinifaciens TaxID=392412 RepID=UPI003D04A8A4